MKHNHLCLILITLITTISIYSCSIIDFIFSFREISQDCDIFHWCASNLDCRDYRCSNEGTEDNQVKWAPEGSKCDPFHKCSNNQKCKMHRCQTGNAMISPISCQNDTILPQ